MGFDEGGIFFDGSTVQGDTANFTYKNNVFTGVTKLVEPVTFNDGSLVITTVYYQTQMMFY